MSAVTVLLPARNEAAGIAEIIREVRSVPVLTNIVVVDSASIDNTPEIARECGAEVIMAGKGKGNAIRTAINQLTGPYTLMMNSDLSYSAEHIPEILHKLESGYDVVIGERMKFEDNSSTEFNRFGNEWLVAIFTILFKVNISDLCTGMWGFRTDVLKQLTINSTGFTLEAELYCETVERGLKWTTVPVIYRRRAGVSHFKPKDGFKIAWFMVKRRLNGCRAS